MSEKSSFDSLPLERSPNSPSKEVHTQQIRTERSIKENLEKTASLMLTHAEKVGVENPEQAVSIVKMLLQKEIPSLSLHKRYLQLLFKYASLQEDLFFTANLAEKWVLEGNDTEESLTEIKEKLALLYKKIFLSTYDEADIGTAFAWLEKALSSSKEGGISSKALEVALLYADISGEPETYQAAITLLDKWKEKTEKQTTLSWMRAALYGRLSLFTGNFDLQERASIFFRKAFHDNAAIPEKETFLWMQIELSLFERFFQDHSFRYSIIALEKLLEKSPQDPALCLKRGELFLKGGMILEKVDLAEKALERLKYTQFLLKGTPLELAELLIEAYLYLAVEQEKAEYFTHSHNLLNDLLLKHPDSTHVWLLWCKEALTEARYFKDEQRYRKALKRCESAIEQNPSPLILKAYAETFADFALFLDHEEALNKSLEHLTFTEEQLPQNIRDHTFYLSWGKVALELAKIFNNPGYAQIAKEKLQLLEEIPAKNSAKASALLHLAEVYLFLGEVEARTQDLEKAIFFGTKALSLNLQSVEAKNVVALSVSRLGESVGDVDCLEKACDLFEQILKKDPEQDELWSEWGLALLTLAVILKDPALPDLFHRNLLLAESKFLAAARLGNLECFYHLACLYALLEKEHEALFYLEKAFQHGVIPGVTEVLQDEWLSSLHDNPDFIDLIERMRWSQGEIDDL